MPAKKAPSSREQKRDAIRVEVPLNGLYMDKFVAFPVWDAAEMDKESWGEFIANDPSSFYTDADSALLGTQLFEGLDNSNIEWKRPSVLFSPFKPVVYRPSATVDANPYDNAHDESEEGKAARDAAISSYRELRPLRAVGDEDEATARAAAAKSRVAAATAALTAGTNSPSAATPRRRAGAGAQPTPVPFLMGAFQSALMILSQNQHHIQPGCFGWELIYPQAPNPHGLPIPVINPAGKYCVRLFVGGAFRKVTIDDRLPADSSGRSIFTVTDYKEIWPALLVKAIMKVLTPALEAQIALNPVVSLSTLMCGWTPQVLSPTADELLVYRMLQRVRTASENLVIVATCSDSAAQYTTGAISPATTANLQLLAIESAQSNQNVGAVSSGNNNSNSNSNGMASSGVSSDNTRNAIAANAVGMSAAAAASMLSASNNSSGSGTTPAQAVLSLLSAQQALHNAITGSNQTKEDRDNEANNNAGASSSSGISGPGNSATNIAATNALAAANSMLQLGIRVPGMPDKREPLKENYKSVGLRAYHAYHIVDMRSYGPGFLLRLVCPGATYTGPYSYDSDDWSSDLIDAIGFNPTEHRNPHELGKRWNDFWVPWDQFKDYFASFVVFRYAADKKAFPHFKNFPAEIMVPGENGVPALAISPSNNNINTPLANNNNNTSATGNSSPSPATTAIGRRSATTTGGGAGANSSSKMAASQIRALQNGSVNADNSQNGIEISLPPEHMIPKHQKTSVRWVHLVNTDAENESSALIVLTGLPTANSVIQAAIAPPPPVAKAAKGSSSQQQQHQQQAALAAQSLAAQLSVAPPSAQDTENEPQSWSVQVHRFDWNQSQPFCLLKKQSCSRGLNQAFYVVLPAGRGTTLRLTIANCPIGCAVGVLSSCEISSGNEREVVLDGSGIVFGSDAGNYAEHLAPSNASTINNALGGSASLGSGGGNGDHHHANNNVNNSFELTGPGQFSNPSALQTATIWFKRHIVVKADTTASFVLSTLGKNADLNAHRLIPQDQLAAGGKGVKGAKGATGAGQNQPGQSQQGSNNNQQQQGASSGQAAKGAKGKGGADKDGKNDPFAQSGNSLGLDGEGETEPLRPISDYANLILVDVETGTTTVDTIGKLLNVHLAANTQGYMLMAVARTPEPYKKGNWKLSYYSSRIFDIFESKNFEDVASKTGQYVQNDFRQVFRYNFFFPVVNDKGGEAAGPSATIQCCLRDDSGQPVPFTLELHHGIQDPAIASNAAAQSAALTGGITDPTASHNSPGSPASSVNAGGASVGREKKSKDEPPEPIPMEVISTRTTSHYAVFEHIPLSAHEKNTPSYYSLVCTLDHEYASQWEQRRKEQVIEGFKATTEKQAKLFNQQQWTRYQALKRNPGAPLPKELEQQDSIPEVTPGKIVFSVSLHFSNPKYELKEDSSISDALNAVKQSWGRKEAEERAAAAAAATGKKQTASKKVNAKDEQQMADEIAAHFARAKAARDRFLSNRKGIFMPYLNQETGQPVLDAFHDPSLRHIPMAPTSDWNSFKKDPVRAAEASKLEALSKALAHATPVQYAKKLAEETIETSAVLRNARKTWITRTNDTLNAHWAEVAPSKPISNLNQAQEDVDEKSKRGGRGAVGGARTVAGRR